MSAAVTKTPTVPVPAWATWSSLLYPVLGALGYWIMHKHGGMKLMEEMVKEMEETRETRDAAVSTAAQAFKLVEHFMAAETLLREKLKAAEVALKKEREDSMEKFHKDFDARQNLEKANEDWKRKHADLEVRCARLEATVQQYQSNAKNIVDGWWTPAKDGEHTLKGVLVDFIDKNSSDMLQSNMLVFRLTETCDGCRDGGSTNLSSLALSTEGDGELYRASTGSLIGVPEWKQLVGLWPKKAGHEVHITRGEMRDIGMGRKMYSIETQISKKPVDGFKKRRGTIKS